MLINDFNGAKRLALAAVLMTTVTACYMEVDDDSDYDDDYAYEDDYYTPPTNYNLDDMFKTCEDYAKGDTTAPQYCANEDDFSWRTSCKESSCQSVKVFVHYMLQDDLGDGRAVHIEAFDNPNFVGAPTGTVRIASFTAKTGEWRAADLFLEPGEYYLRAYLTTADDEVSPYTMQGMTLVADQPVGVFGALSGAEMIRVEPRDQNSNTDPVHIYLNKLFKQPGSEPDTKAFLRAQYTVENSCVIPDGRKVWLSIFESDDLEAAPVASYSMNSEALLVQGRIGRADFLTPSLPEGQYIVFAYVDVNGNELFDLDEPSALHKRNDVAAMVKITKNHTTSLALKLSTPDSAAAATAEETTDATAGQ